jgi:2-keto-4-pentenoate hydratase/2-oxohepta-3-ene-1,7-dioic acid hydratase in catechol pathway
MCRSDLIFSIPKLISFLSQGTTLQAGTIILTGTPAGVGVSRKPPRISEGGRRIRGGDLATHRNTDQQIRK